MRPLLLLVLSSLINLFRISTTLSTARSWSSKMTREIFLIRYLSYPFKHHWGFFIPSTTNPSVGTIIHVEGSVRASFEHQIKRNYDLTRTSRAFSQILLGRVEDRHVHIDQTFEPSSDTSPRDDIENLALTVPAPDPSMNPIAENAVRLPPTSCT